MSGLIRAIAVVALLTAGCGGKPSGAEPASGGSGTPQPPPPDSSTAATSSTSVPTTGPISGPPLSSTHGGKPIPTGAPPGTCQSQPSLRITAGARPDPVCLPVNGLLHLASDPSPHQAWATLVSSDPKILSCTSQVSTDGAVTGTCTPHLPGTVTVTTGTAPFAGDPSGPPQYQWSLRVTVVGYGFNN